MNEFQFKIKVEGRAETAKLRFASWGELQQYHRSLAPFARQSSTTIREAVEFTRLAAKRWHYYSRSSEAVESFNGLRHAIRHNTKSEIAFIMVALVKKERHGQPVGLAYCRRTWCHHFALDFLALHPRVLMPPGQVEGLGSGIIFGLVQLAKSLGIRRIWGEATVNSARFYEKLLEVSPIHDLFIIEAPEMAAITRRQRKIGTPPLSMRG